ncbi:acyl-CoA synthetase [Halioglobus japonicus]|uniref:Acyl-CoA synthetase n=1 Tax=Halioglobus japonicus TaxID=930805 RepID=A0AAP8MF85_9GAMM|nr:long-chain fatty acid--CoA ligase [Halioglobus japonicus]AQA18684.1 acyl-CoA synthetase [Halioglobus japonicus]PLW86712.1 acyl-CoA synthetase [Halioglobus japonicus]GHD11466.1 acyl-CoA synthetase [Halioglobus japonicus]
MNRPEIDYNFAAAALRRADLNPDRIAVVFEEQEITYAEFADRVRRQAQLLRDAGVCVGDRVGYLGFNHPALLETLFATQALGAIFVPLNFRLTAEELTFIINDAGVHSLVVDDALRPVVEPALDKLCCRRYFSSESEADGWRHLSSERAACEPLTSTVAVDQHETGLIMYTSGTTGLPKGAMLTHGNFVWNNINASMAFGASRDNIILTAAPLFHIGGLNVMTLHSFHLGSKLVLLRNFDPAAVLENFERYKVTHMFGAPAMYLFMAQLPQFADTDLSSLDVLVCGAAPVPESLIETYGARGVSFCQGYGLTETAPFSALLTPEHAVSKLGSAGQVPLYSGTRIVDADNQPLPAGEKGEICLRGPNIMKGYWNRPEATASAIDSEGWFHSGDIGYLDDEGFLYICDRLKDMVISGGENVYPAEVEGVLYKHEAIAEVAVIGTPDEKWGEAVTAVVALHEGASLTLEGLREFADPFLARYKLPLRMEVVEALPRNPAGKVLKFVLKEQIVGE